MTQEARKIRVSRALAPSPQSVSMASHGVVLCIDHTAAPDSPVCAIKRKQALRSPLGMVKC